VRFGLSGEGFPLHKPEIKRSVLAFDAIEQMPRYAALPTTERDKELSGPKVWDREFDLLWRLAAGGIPKECANAVGSSTSCGLLASRKETRRQ
jgi:hypothetical protein